MTLRRVAYFTLKSIGLKAMLAYRLGRWLLAAGSRWYLWPLVAPGWVAYGLLVTYVRICHDIRLSLSARIGPGLHIAHFGNIVVRDCELGEGCAIRQSVHVEPADHGVGPVVGDHTWFGPHCRVVGPYHVGSRCTLAAGCVVRSDIPDGALCIGEPAKVLRRNYDNAALHAPFLS